MIKGYCACPRPWTGDRCEEVDSSLCWDEYEEKVTSGLTSLERQEFKRKGCRYFLYHETLLSNGLIKCSSNKSLEDAKKKCDELGANDCGSIILTNQGQLRLSLKLSLIM